MMQEGKRKYTAVELARLKKAGIVPQEEVSPEALAAFYRSRAESVRQQRNYLIKQGTQATPTRGPIEPPRSQPQSMGIFDYIISALKGTPGQQ